MVIARFFDVNFAIKNQGHFVDVVGQGVIDGRSFALAGHFGGGQGIKVFKLAFVVFVSQLLDGRFKLVQQSVLNVPKSDGAVVALNAKRCFGYFFGRSGASGYPQQDHVFVDGDTIEDNFAEYGWFDLAALGVKLRGLKMDL